MIAAASPRDRAGTIDPPLLSNVICPVTIGRSAELTAIEAFLAQPSGLLLISGDAGIGKSRLVREACTLTSDRGVRVLEARCFEADRALPFAPAPDILRELVDRFGVPEVRRFAGSAASDLARLLPELATDTKSDTEAIDGEVAKRRLLDAFARLLIGIADEQPLLLVVEDIQWPDASSLDLLLHLARRTSRERLSLVLTYRSDEVHPDLEHFLATLDRERLGSEIRLERLDAGQVSRMLQAIFAVDAPVPADFLHAVYSLTEGNPFFIEEVLTAMERTRHFVAADGSWTREDVHPPRIPRSIRDAVRLRLAALSEPARNVLTVAAVAGRRFEFELLGELSGLDEAALLDSMKELVALRLVVEETDDRFVFRHALTREAIYSGLLDRERRQLHRRIAEAIERLYATSLETRLDDLAAHSFEARSWARALDTARRAGLRAAALHAPRAAVKQFTRSIEAGRALGLPEDADLHQERGRAYETLGEFMHALADYELALDLARAADDRHAEWQILLDLGLLWASRDYAQTGHFAALALDVARQIDDEKRIAHSLNRLGNWKLNVEQPQNAIARHREALALLETLGDERGVAETLDLLGMATIMGADAVGAMQWYARAAETWRGMGDPRGLAASLMGWVMAAHTFHTSTIPSAVPIDEVHILGEESLVLTREIDWRAGQSFALWSFRGMTLGAAGEYDVALPATREALAIAREIEHRQWMTGARCILGNLYADLGDLEAARAELEGALQMARQVGSPYWMRSAAGWLASVLIRAGTLAAAAAVLDDELDEETPRDAIAGRLLWCAAAELALAQGQPTRTLELVAALAASTPGDNARPIARLDLLRGQALMALARESDAAAALSAARNDAIWSGARPLLWRIEIARGRLFQAQHQCDEATLAFASARALIEELASVVPDELLRERFVSMACRDLPQPASLPKQHALSVAKGSLTKRELNVATLLMEGLTNREIGERLYLSEWTIATHVRNILAKLDLNSRAQIAAWAASQGITRGA